ncbi:hypothetical protein BGX27_011209 [Mortierella sp. AM989]|nr:hypothetical protein BGX27_011209 [Mortierella sp. AM989]
MIRGDPNQQYPQLFRACSSTGVPSTTESIAINARWDSVNNEYIILWSEIIQIFKTAQYIKNNNALVPFMTDAQFENILPKRILYHPGVTLYVVPKDLEQTPDTSPRPTLVSAPDSSTSTTTLVNDEYNAIRDEREKPLETGQIVSKKAHQFDPIDAQIAALAKDVMPNPPLDAGIINSMYEHFRKLELEMENNRVFRADVRDNLRQVNNRLRNIQGRIQAVFRQTYELHEYPIPRLFIVLPKVSRRRDRLCKPFMKQFRLFFLCECGAHTKTEGSRISHEIHLAKHEGYDLDRPTEFFEKYGPYVMTMMQMMKYGFAAAGVVVPGLAQFKIVEGINTAHHSLEYARSTLGTLVDETINYIQDKSGSGFEPDSVTNSYELSRQEVLEGADLRQLESYLGIQDHGRVLGNLYRTVTHEGHVKWVCMDHYRENYREAAINQLREVIDENDGHYNEEYGTVSISISSKQSAKQFYDILVKARAIQELDITLAWDVKLDDLRAFEAAVSKASIVHLTMNGSHFKGSKWDLLNTGRRFDPIVNLLFNGRIQSLHLKYFEEFYQHVSGSSLLKASQFRVLSIDSMLSFKDRSAVSAFKKILSECPSLTKLTIRSDNILNVLDWVAKEYCGRQLETLVLNFSESAILVKFSQGSIQNVLADIDHLMDIEEQPLFFAKGLLTGLKARHFPTRSLRVPSLQKTIAQNPKILNIDIATPIGSFHTIIDLVKATRDKMISEERPIELRQLRLQTYDWSKDREIGCEDTITTTLDFSDPSLETKSSTNVELCAAPNTHDAEIIEFLNRYGWSIENLVVNKSFNDHHASVIANSTMQGRCELKSIRFDPTSLSSDGLQNMDLIFDRSANLEHLVMGFHDLHSPRHREKAVRELILYGTQLKELTLSGNIISAWHLEIKNSIRNREALPRLESFSVICSELEVIPDSCVEWLVAMLQLPPEYPPTAPSSPLSSAICSYFRTLSSLRDIRLEYMELCTANWRLLIGALDFSSLETLSFENTNFSMDEFQYLLASIPDVEAQVSLKVFYVKDSYLVKCDDETLQELVADFEDKTFGGKLVHCKNK